MQIGEGEKAHTISSTTVREETDRRRGCYQCLAATANAVDNATNALFAHSTVE